MRYCEKSGCHSAATWCRPSMTGEACCEAHKEMPNKKKLDRLKKQVDALEAEIEECEKSYKPVKTLD